MDNAAITLFVYNRPAHTQQTINALQKNLFASDSDLFIFSDGPRRDKDKEKVQDVRKFLKTIKGFKSVNILESFANKGLANSIIEGVSEVLKRHDSTIVLEDDLVTSPHFLSYMNQALRLYNNEPKVVCINGYFYPTEQNLPQSFFLRGADCQGWATWRRGWQVFNADGGLLLRELRKRKLLKEFDYDNSYGFGRMLDHQQKGLVDSWAIRWYASAFLQEKLCLYPGLSLVKNIGFDNTGTNSSDWDKKRYDTPMQMDEVQLTKIEVKEDLIIRASLADYFRRTQKPLGLKIRHKVKAIIKRYLDF